MYKEIRSSRDPRDHVEGSETYSEIRGVDRELHRGCAPGPSCSAPASRTSLVINRVDGSDLGADATKRW